MACASATTTGDEIARQLGAVPHDAAPEVVDLARAHALAPLVHHRLGGVRAPLATRVVADLAVDRALGQARHQLTLRALADLDAVLQRPFLVVKGPALALGWYDDPALRVYHDLDLLVRRRDFTAALEALRMHGFEEAARNWRGFLEHRVAEVPVTKGSTCVDLHWDTVALGRDRRAVSLDVEDLFAHAVGRAAGPLEVRTPDATDTLLHVCVNAGLDGARRLSRLVDVDRVARDPGIDWSRFVASARRGGAHALAHAVLRRSRGLLATPVPPEVLQELSPFAGWGLLTPPRLRRDRRLTRGVSGGLLVSSGRATPHATARAAAHSIRGAVLEARGRGASQPGGALDWQRDDVPGDSSRQRYLDWVSGAAG